MVMMAKEKGNTRVSSTKSLSQTPRADLTKKNGSTTFRGKEVNVKFSKKSI